MNIAVLTSGGVDSSVALHLLQKQGYDVTAFYIKIWIEDYFDDCPWEEDLSYVRKLVKELDVPLRVVNLQKEYWSSVITYALNEVKKGNTPNPDMMCNSLIKFGAFEEKYGKKFDAVATGHYTQHDEAKHLKMAKDKIKDQTYFLARLEKGQVQRIIFPIGHLLKTEVRDIAKENQLPTADRPDSQGLCFLGKVRFKDFLKEQLGERTGDIIDQDTNEIVGEHDGFWFYTIGQREGLGIGGTKLPYYVSAKDPQKNLVYVSQGRKNPDLWVSKITITDLKIFMPNMLQKGTQYLVKVRHPDPGRKAILINLSKDNATIELSEPVFGIASGQFVVLYKDNLVIGSGEIIDS